MRMDDVPYEIDVKGVKGRRLRSGRHYSGREETFVLDVTYRFDLEELHEVDAAKYYPLPEQDKEVEG